ncbi:hypothetical protein FHS85_004323 [Rhodoligotrophos appendicifer]|uniref:DUF1656 domain-containing protein n=1 Tax=Rhodoligotrophos appendicifer TaxID=987056 RepID=UPI001185E61F|nr:DUF1656 domain-containing protein [Rhodoligotrophos appendicifer]
MSSLNVESLQPLDVFGFYLPTLALWILLTFIPFFALRWVMRRSGLDRFVWHRPLFDVALFIVLLGGMIFSGVPRWL